MKKLLKNTVLNVILLTNITIDIIYAIYQLLTGKKVSCFLFLNWNIRNAESIYQKIKKKFITKSGS